MIRRLHVPLTRPEDVIPHLAKPDLHWKAGYSAQELAYSWARAKDGFPLAVRAALNTAEEYRDAELIDAFFEREVDLGTPGRNSQTDLMAIVGLGSELGVVAVEGKVEESFADFVRDWNDSPGKAVRLAGLCGTLGMEPGKVSSLRYQLLHRTASAIYEAKRYRARHAVMLVHSFSRDARWFEDFTAFSRMMGIPVEAAGRCSAATICEGISLRLAWVSDQTRITSGFVNLLVP